MGGLFVFVAVICFLLVRYNGELARQFHARFGLGRECWKAEPRVELVNQQVFGGVGGFVVDKRRNGTKNG